MGLEYVKGWERENNAVILKFENGMGSITFAEDDILRLTYCCGGSFDEEDDYILSSIPMKRDFEVKEGDGYIELISKKIDVKLWLNPFDIGIKDKKGNEIIKRSYRFLSASGKCKVARFHLDEDESIFGLGQDPMANLSQRDRERRMWHQWGSNGRSGNAGIPFMLSSKGYGIFLNSSYPSRFAIGKAEVAEFNKMGDIMAPAPWPWNEDSGETDGDTSAILLDDGSLDIFIICRKKFDQIIQGYSALTGFTPLLPKWAYGFMQCKNRYRSQEELLDVARTIRKKKIPCDVLIIDWLWFKEFGDLKWDRRYWPDVESMFRELSALGFKVMSAQHPFISENGGMYKSFKEQGFLNSVPEGKRITFDHSNPEARRAWWNKIKPLYSQGIRGYWTDMGEIEEHFPGTISYMGTREKVHNIYSLLWSKGLYDGQRGDFGKRVFTLARTAYAGIQKYGTGMWSGDIDASWEVLRRQVVVGQEVCLSGMPYWTTDIGGFLTNMDFTPELYVRWLEWGVFCPLFRTHGTRPSNEIWGFGSQTEEICRKYIELRYRLLPYIYSCTHRITNEGRPLMRAMVMDYSDDKKAAESIHQFMFGPNILVAPVLEKGRRKQDVYLPQGAWYDFWTGEKYAGGRNITVSAPLDRIPLFIKSGSIITMGPVREYVDEGIERNITVHIYPGWNASFELYDDDGMTYNYEQGHFIKTLIQYEESEDRAIRIIPVHFDENLGDRRNYEIVMHDILKPTSIEIDNEPYVDWNYNADGRTLSIDINDILLNNKLEVVISGFEKCSTDEPDVKTFEKDEISEIVGNLKLSADADMECCGNVTINLSVDRCPGLDLPMNANLKVSDGWTIYRSDRFDHDINSYWKQNVYTEDIQRTHISVGSQLTWNVSPIGEYLPAVFEGNIDVELLLDNKSIHTETIPITWGSGYITRWSLISGFKNNENKGLDYQYEPETNPNIPFYYVDGKKLEWVRDRQNEFNCFGYVDLRRLGVFAKGEAISGIAYSKCTIWSEKNMSAYIELSVETGIKIWINNEEIISSNEIIINKIMPEPVKLNKGCNNILVKSAVFSERPYSGREFGFNMRIVDEHGSIIRELLYRL